MFLKTSIEKAILIGIVVIAFGTATYFVTNLGPDHKPSQVVERWIQLYPHDLGTAATLTSWGMRNGLSPEAWIHRATELTGEFRFLDGQIVSETIEDEAAEVLVDTRIASALGEQSQRESYHLSVVDNHWVIEKRSVIMVFPSLPSIS